MPLRSRGLGLCVAIVAIAGTRLAPADDLATKAQAILKENCSECHGAKPDELKGELNLFVMSQLTDDKRKIVVPKKPDDSEMIRRIESKDADVHMPPSDGKHKALDADSTKALRDWIAAGALPFAAEAAAISPKAAARAAVTPKPGELAARVKSLFRSRCFGCHGGAKTNAGIRILDHALLVEKKKKVIPGQPDASAIYRVIVGAGGTKMPPLPNRELDDADKALVRDWIVAGAPNFPEDVAQQATAETPVKDAGSAYVLGKILAHVRTVRVEDRLFIRYFSSNHLVAAGASREELDLERDAFAKAINHLSREPRIVTPTVVDAPMGTIFAVDIRELGWHQQPLHRLGNNQVAEASPLTIFDMALLEYPYAIIDEESQNYAMLLEEFMAPGRFIRPIPYLRVDWFVSTVTQPPLYEDFLQLPFDVAELEKQLGVDSNNDIVTRRAKRAAMSVSGVSRNNRMVERHDFRHGAYWKSIDTNTSKGRQNFFLDPINPRATGGSSSLICPTGCRDTLSPLRTVSGSRKRPPPSLPTNSPRTKRSATDWPACGVTKWG